MKSQPKPLKAYKNPDFIDSIDAREVRILSEFLEPKKRFSDQNIEDTVVFFGSARIKSKREAGKLLSAAKKKYSTRHSSYVQAQNIYRMSKYYEDAVELSSLLTTWAKKLGKGTQRYIVCSGGGPGIMEAANKGARNAKGSSIGFNISIPFEQNSNAYITKSLNFEFHYFFIRKYWFAYMAKALVIFPGGFGTIDELFEILTLIQTRKMTKSIPILVYGTEYWNSVFNFKELVKWGTISQRDLGLFHFCDDPKEAFNYLSHELEKRFGR
ncbi:MAG: TIGR00730 family Rossman fold protein [Bdellovibrionales bacterium]|nr:TIGR00730 family Rossman fold protein [Bdellovibrionales bacterium]